MAIQQTRDKTLDEAIGVVEKKIIGCTMSDSSICDNDCSACEHDKGIEDGIAALRELKGKKV